jgi:DNA-binding CsgD family transcriptional regulator/tetratricopeptide (TPR) repeat protein
VDAPTGLAGREHELTSIASVVDRARRGRLGVALVTGEAGIGKTALVRHALRTAHVPTLWASGAEAEAEVDLGVVEQLVRSARIGEEARRRMLDGLRAVGGEAVGSGSLLIQLLDGIELDAANPFAVVVDDAQWADAASLLALAFAARRLRTDPVLLLLLVRGTGSELPSGVLRLVDDLGIRIPVGPLDAKAVRSAVVQATGVDVGAPGAQRLTAHIRGNPLDLESLLAEVDARRLADLDVLPAPQSVAALVARRADVLPPSSRALVEAVAVLGDPAPLALAGAIAEADGAEAIDAALASGLVAIGPGDPGAGGTDLVVPQPLVRAALLGQLPVGRRAALHRRAGSVVGGIEGLRHRLLGAAVADGQLWREATEVAAAEADRGAHGSAAMLLGLAVAVAPGAAEREATVQERLEQQLLAGRLGLAASLVPEVEGTAPSARRSQALARASYVLGPRRAAPAHLADAWTRLTGDDDPGALPRRAEDRRLAGRVAAMRAMVRVDRARGAEAAAWARAALSLAPAEASQASAAHMLASAHALQGTFDAGCEELDALCEPSERRGRAAVGPSAADVRSARGLLRLWTHQLDGAAEDLEASLHAIGDQGAFVARETARFYLAEVRYRQGRWDEAVELAARSASLADDSEQDWMAALPHGTAARPLAARGQPADDHVQRALASAASVGAGVTVVLARVAALEVAACRRDHATVVGLSRELRALGAGQFDERIAPWRASAVDALVARGDLDEAGLLAAELGASPSTPLVRTDAARAAAALAAASGDLQALEAAGASGLGEDPEAVGPYPRARLELVLGAAWRRRGERRRAVALLEASLQRFQALGARPWAEQVERELAASGLRPVRRHARSSTALTPQEQAVARLVAGGATNREVAADLVVSVKTVEHHLSRIYAKVGVRSRTELASRLRSSS